MKVHKNFQCDILKFLADQQSKEKKGTFENLEPANV